MNTKRGLDTVRSLLDSKGWLEDPADTIPYAEERRGLFRSHPGAVALPTSTQQVAAVVTACAQHGIAVVPQGGNTGLCGGAVASSERPTLILNLQRMNKVLDVDPLNHTLTAEAGCILANIQDAANSASRYFPLSLGAEGSCQIGGNLATNAGGINVIRYGNARDLCLGLEVVLADGRIWNGLNRLRKNNTGYDLKNLFVGAEGTLGVITRVVLKLFPKPQNQQTAMIALDDAAGAIGLLALAREFSSDNVQSFELMSRVSVNLALKHHSQLRAVFEEDPPWSVLLAMEADRASGQQPERIESLLTAALEQGLITDAVLAVSESQASEFWRLREAIVDAQKIEGASVKHDVSVPVSRIAEFLSRANAAVTRQVPGIRPCAFGHVGDGNMHYNLTQPESMLSTEFMAMRTELNSVVHDIVYDMGGSFSAEHGVGCLKLGEMQRYKSAVELDLMRSIKLALDPANIMNPGKVVPERPQSE